MFHYDLDLSVWTLKKPYSAPRSRSLSMFALYWDGVLITIKQRYPRRRTCFGIDSSKGISHRVQLYGNSCHPEYRIIEKLDIVYHHEDKTFYPLHAFFFSTACLCCLLLLSSNNPCRCIAKLVSLGADHVLWALLHRATSYGLKLWDCAMHAIRRGCAS